jgi:nucleoside-diphosphate-sugar epimerase
MSRNALIGYSGFVGSNLMRRGQFECLFNSVNFREMRGQHFRTVVCAGVSAVKWEANLDPAADWAAIRKLIEVLATVEAERFILVSTVDVYRNPELPLDEDSEIAPGNHAYGLHRLQLEQWLSTRFDNRLIVRLPALFGPGLKKNALYDIINNHELEKINPDHRFQWYPVERLYQDLARLTQHPLRLVNLVTEPITIASILERHFPGRRVGPGGAPASYALRSRHADVLGGRDGFLLNSEQVHLALASYISERDAAAE